MAEAFAERMKYLMSEILDLVIKDKQREILELGIKESADVRDIEILDKEREILELERKEWAGREIEIFKEERDKKILEIKEFVEREMTKTKVGLDKFLDKFKSTVDKFKSTLGDDMKKMKVGLDKFKSTLGDELHDDKIRKREDKSAVLLWVGELEDVTYKTEDALDKWRVVNSDELVSRRRFQPLALCCPAYPSALNGLKVILSTMESQVETLLSKGMKFVEETKLKRPDSDHQEEVCMVRFRQFYHTYDTLPPYMKSCLLFTAFFPKGAVIDDQKLILLWMSQGYLGYPILEYDNVLSWKQKVRAYGNVENNGSECLTRLIGHLFFEKIESQSIHKPHPISYKMPDAAHDFVTCMSHLRHINGRSYFTTPGKKVTPDLFGKLKRMTALILSSSQLDELPEEVRLLTRLQYLDLRDNPLKRLPPTVCELYHLEFLDVQCCYLLSCLPEKIGELSQMRHLRINHTTEELHDLPSGFGYLTLLRTLDVFRVGGKYKDAVNKLTFFDHLVDLCISVHGEAQFDEALMEDKIYMKTLELHFVGEGRNQEMASSVERLIPPPSLQMLKFEHYPGFTLPSWILAKSVIDNLTRLSIRSAANISSLPALWKLSSLEFLWLYDIPNLKHLGCEFFGHTNTPKKHHSPEANSQHMRKDDDLIEEINVDSEANHEEITAEDPVQDTEREDAVAFRSLKTFRIEYLKNWETWEDANEADEVNIKVMPCLEELIIAHCPKLQGRPLHILRDSPWFKNKGEMHEKNMKQASQKGATVALKASYIKLKNFVHDAYMTKAPAQPLKVTIPEGVLGKTRVTSYLPLDSLHVWFEEDRSIFAEQLCVWSKHIYELMTPSDKERVQMASSALIKTVGRQQHSGMRAEDLVDFMMENKAKLYLVPLLRPGHWELLAIVPESEIVYWFDSLQGNISLELTKFLNMVERKYVSRNLNSATTHNSWKVVDIKHKRQVDNWECGYYVMIWMQKIALEIQDLNIESHFPTDTSSYEAEKLREVDWKWCAHVMPEFVA